MGKQTEWVRTLCLVNQTASPDPLWLDAPIDSRELPDDFVNFIRDLRQRLNNSLSLEGLNVAEHYLDGRLHVLLDLEIPIDRTFAGEGRANEAMGIRFEIAAGKSDHATWHVQRELGDFRQCKVGNQQMVFVADAQIVQTPKGPVASTMWLQSQDHAARFGRERLYFSSGVGFQFLRVCSEREVDFTQFSSTESLDLPNGEHEMVERRSQVLNHVADNESDVRFDAHVGDFDVQAILSGLRIEAMQNLVRVGGKLFFDYPYKLTKMAIGPFNL